MQTNVYLPNFVSVVEGQGFPPLAGCLVICRVREQIPS